MSPWACCCTVVFLRRGSSLRLVVNWAIAQKGARDPKPGLEFGCRGKILKFFPIPAQSGKSRPNRGRTWRDSGISGSESDSESESPLKYH